MKQNRIIRSRTINETSKDFKSRMLDLLTCINAMYVNQATEWSVVFMHSSREEIADAIFTEQPKATK